MPISHIVLHSGLAESVMGSTADRSCCGHLESAFVLFALTKRTITIIDPIKASQNYPLPFILCKKKWNSWLWRTRHGHFVTSDLIWSGPAGIRETPNIQKHFFTCIISNVLFASHRSHLCMLFDGTRTAYSQPYEVFYYISTHEDDFFALLRVLVRLHLYYPTKSVKVEDEIYIDKIIQQRFRHQHTVGVLTEVSNFCAKGADADGRTYLCRSRSVPTNTVRCALLNSVCVCACTSVCKGRTTQLMLTSSFSFIFP